MFRISGQFDKLLDKATSNFLMDPEWTAILQICDLVRQNDVQPKHVMGAIKKKLFAPNPYTAYYALLVLESLVKNCGTAIHEELTAKSNCDMLHELVKTTQHDNVRQKLLELIQTWAFAFRKNPKYNTLKDVMNLMKSEGYKFPTLRESDAMFTADSAPEWSDGESCHRCRTIFSVLTRKHHCRNCGQVFCSQCSQKSIPLPHFGIEKEVRVCDGCYEKVSKPLMPTTKSSTAKVDDSELPAEYLSSPLSQQSQLPPRKTEDELLREEEELQLALALSQSEAEAKSKDKFKGLITQPTIKSEVRQPERTPSPTEELPVVSPELSRYLDRNYWENRQSDVPETNRPTSPSAPATAPVQNNEVKCQENGLTDAQMHDFINTLKSQVEIFINRMKSNSSRGRSIANDSSVQTLFLNITAMHSQLLRYIQQHDDSRLYYERLQDKLTQVKDARAALDALRDEHQDKMRRVAEEVERQRQLQMAHKLDIMRKKKQEYLQYQRQVALQRVQEQEREMQMRQEQQKQQYLMGSGYGTYKGSPVHGQLPPNAIPSTGYRTYPYDVQIMMPGRVPSVNPIRQPSVTVQMPILGMTTGIRPGLPNQGPQQGLPVQGAPQNLPPGLQHQQQLPQQNLPQMIPTTTGLPPQQNLSNQPNLLPQSGVPLQQGLPQNIPLGMRMSQSNIPQGPPQVMPQQQFQQPGAPPAGPQVSQTQPNGDPQTAELISFD